jgi:hypothetical protein
VFLSHLQQPQNKKCLRRYGGLQQGLQHWEKAISIANGRGLAAKSGSCKPIAVTQ